MTSLVPAASMEGNHKSNPNQVKEDMMKDVACLLFTTPTRLSYYSVTVYLIDIQRQKLVTFLHLYDNCTSNVGFVVYKSMLYIFGGRSKCVDLPDAYVLDLYQLAKATSCLDKPSPTKLAPMNFGKSHAVALLVRDKILVFDTYVGHESNSCHFELYDPDQNTWTQVPDPCHLSTGSSVNAHYVKDDKVFMYIRKKEAVFVLSIGATTSPSWSHHVDIGYGDLCYNPFRDSEGVIFGSWLVCLNDVCDLEDERCFASYTGSVVWTDKTGTKPYDISREFSSKIFRLGSDKVCTIKPAIVYKPKHIKPKVQKVKMDGRKSMLVQQSVIRKRQGERKGSFRMIVKVWSVNAISETGAHMEVLKSFTVPIYKDNCKFKSHTMPLYPGPDAELGEIKMVSLCYP